MKKNTLFLLAVTASLLTLSARAQNIGINEDGAAPNANAILDLRSTTKGLLIPRMSSSQRLNIPVTQGLLVYDTTLNKFMFHNGSLWLSLTPDQPSAWLTTGNAAIDSNSFLGTLGNNALRFKSAGTLAGLVDRNQAATFFGGNAGGPNPHNSVFNTGIGDNALASNTIGQANTAVGCEAMSANTTGTFNVAIGRLALKSNSSGTINTAVGAGAMVHNNSGGSNTAYGGDAMSNNSTGNQNTALGTGSMFNTTTGAGNTAVGTSALNTNVSGSVNTAIGQGADVSSDALLNATAIGAGAIVNASNKVRIGSSAVTVIEGQVPFTIPSDGRFKYQVREDVKGLDFILQLRPVTYQFDVKRFDDQDGNPNGAREARQVSNAVLASYKEATRIRRSGFIAQEVERAANASGYDFSGIIKPATNEAHYSLSYESFVVPLVKSVQEQQRTILDQQQRIDDLQRQIDELKKLLTPAR